MQKIILHRINKHMKTVKFTIPIILIILLSLGIVSLATGNSNPTGPSPNSLPEFLPNQNPSIVMIISSDGIDGPFFQGTGFFVNPQGDVITSYHIIAGHKNIQIKTQTGRFYRVKQIITKDIFGDWTRLAVEIPEELVQPAVFSGSTPQPGEEIYVIGHPLGHRQTISYGRISSLFPVQKIGHLLQFNAPITRGSSGSPIFNLSGEVIGITSFMLFMGDGQATLNYAIPTSAF